MTDETARAGSRDEWRAEADDEWLAEHRSELMSRIRRRMPGLGVVSGAIANAETGPYAGAPRNPRLRVDDGKGYAVVRYSADRIAYTTTSTSVETCRRCGRPLAEQHEIEYVPAGGDAVPLGAVHTCRGCQADSWLLRSRMPTVNRARDTARRHVV